MVRENHTTMLAPPIHRPEVGQMAGNVKKLRAPGETTLGDGVRCE